MAKIISLENVKVVGIDINYGNQTVVVKYELQDAVNKTHESGVAIFWVTMPPQPMMPGTGELLPYPEEWFQLPASYVETLLELRNDADVAITNRFL